MESNCLICNRIEAIKNNSNPYFVMELESGYVVMGDFQFYRGYTLLLCREHVSELHQLNKRFKEKFLIEMSTVAEAVFNAFKPKKLNYELLGNGEPHLHWHIFPRHSDDPEPKKPIWLIDKSKREVRPSMEELTTMKKDLLIELEKLTG